MVEMKNYERNEKLKEIHSILKNFCKVTVDKGFEKKVVTSLRIVPFLNKYNHFKTKLLGISTFAVIYVHQLALYELIIEI